MISMFILLEKTYAIFRIKLLNYFLSVNLCIHLLK